jgi:hypothetical protein
LGAGLVERYNDSDPRDPVFSVEDVNVVIRNFAFQNAAEHRVYHPMIEFVQRMGSSAIPLLNEIALYPNTRTDDALASLMARQYDASADQVQRTLEDLDELGLIKHEEARNGLDTWRLTIPLFQDYLRRR